MRGPGFSDSEQADIQKLTYAVVMLLRTGGEWKFPLAKPERVLLRSSGQPWHLVVNNRGAGLVRPPEKRRSVWSRISEFGVVTGQVGQPSSANQEDT